MRLVFPVMLILLSLVLVGFLITNPSQRVDITLVNTDYTDVPLSLVALIALAVGVGFTAIVALIEGATIRLANRRLRREIQRLKAERSLPGFDSDPTASSATGPEVRETGLERPREAEPARPASAPVYDVGSHDRAIRGD